MLRSREFLNISLNSKVYIMLRTAPQLAPTLSQIKQIHINQFHFSKIHFNLLLGLLSVLSPSGFPTPFVHSFTLSRVLYFLWSYSPLPNHSNYIWWRVQTTKLLNMQFSDPAIISPLFGPYILSNLFSKA
jgi:hypothetical protein